jgi:hypothetical protein
MFKDQDGVRYLITDPLLVQARLKFPCMKIGNWIRKDSNGFSVQRENIQSQNGDSSGKVH